jgi:hypothetical protein
VSTLFNFSVGDDYVKRFDYDGNGNVIYAGMAAPGTATSDAGWAIQRYTYTGSNVTLLQWAGGTNRLGAIWDNRAALAYS